MLFEEYCAQSPGYTARPQIFATDLNQAVLEKARRGFYAKSLVEGVSPERLRRFFVEEDGGYLATVQGREVGAPKRV